jgi:hypothetical protein
MWTELSQLGSKQAFEEKVRIQKLREDRLSLVLAQIPDGVSLKAHMKANGYKCLPRNRYEDLTLPLTSEQLQSSICST